jgi:hypothetical protein
MLLYVSVVRSTENNECVGNRPSGVVVRCSDKRYSVARGISYGSVRKILRRELNFRLHKTVAVQELSKHDNGNPNTSSKRLTEFLSDGVIIHDRRNTLPLTWLCHQTELSLLGRVKSKVAPSTAPS